nr:extracellular solute-binding protein [Chloroflexia bacterium]
TITIPEPVAQLPAENLTFRWIDSGDLKALFFEQYFEAYQQAHPNITVQYDPLPWTEISRIVPLGVQNGDAHDVFQIPPEIPTAQAVAEGWVAPLDDIVPNFAAWKEQFPFGSFVDGVHVFNGKTYTFPITSDRRYSTLLLYNQA